MDKGEKKFEDSKSSSKGGPASNSLRTLNRKIDDDIKKKLKWLSFSKSKTLFGLDHLSAVDSPSMASKIRGISIVLRSLKSWSLPQSLLSKYNSQYELSLQFSLSLFHMKSLSFFGSTWIGSPIPLSNIAKLKMKTVLDVDYDEIVYLVTRITDSSCVLIAEVVISILDTKNNVKIGQFGCGWSIIDVFSNPNHPDIAEGPENARPQVSPLFRGSPRELMTSMGNSKDIFDSLQEIPGCSLQFVLFGHRKLLRMQRLINENQLLGRYDCIPGLKAKPIGVLPLSSSMTLEYGTVNGTPMLECIGQDEIHDPKKGVIIIPSKPQLDIPETLHLRNFRLDVEDRLELEEKILHVFRKIAQTSSTSLPSEIQILNRHLKIGVHNGHTILGSQWQHFACQVDPSDEDILLIKPVSMDIHGMLAHPLVTMALVFEMEISLPTQSFSQLSAKAALQSKIRDGVLITTVVLAAGIWFPPNQVLLPSSTHAIEHAEDKLGSSSSLVPSSGTTYLPIELKLSLDEVVTVIDSRAVTLQDLFQDYSSTTNLLQDPSLEDPNLPVSAPGKDSVVPTSAATSVDSSTNIPPVIMKFDVGITHSISSISRRDSLDSVSSQQVSTPDGAKKEVASTGTIVPASPSVKIVSKEAPSVEDRDDVESVVDSLVEGDSFMSYFRFDPEVYRPTTRFALDGGLGITGSNRDRTRGRVAFKPVQALPFSSGAGQSLLERAGGLQLGPSQGTPSVPASVAPRGTIRANWADGLDVEEEVMGAPERRTNDSGQTRVALTAQEEEILGKRLAPHYLTRPLSRAARSRLERFGFDGVLDDVFALPTRASSLEGRPGPLKESFDINLEICDDYPSSEIHIQLAGFSWGLEPQDGTSGPLSPPPRLVYCTFQFYDFAPTRSEILRLLPLDSSASTTVSATLGPNGSKLSSFHAILLREEAFSRQESPFILRFALNRMKSVHENREFARYLANHTLVVEVWNAESLHPLGSATFPLFGLLRQGKPFARVALEGDLIESPSLTSNTHAPMVLMEHGGCKGRSVGTLSILMAHLGTQAVSSSSRPDSKGVSNLPEKVPNAPNSWASLLDQNMGWNWRNLTSSTNAPSVTALVSRASSQISNPAISGRPRNMVVARSLAVTSEEVRQVLREANRQESSKDRGNGNAISNSSMGAQLRNRRSIESSLTYDELQLVFKRFQAPTSKLHVQYVGKFLSLLQYVSPLASLNKIYPYVQSWTASYWKEHFFQTLWEPSEQLQGRYMLARSSVEVALQQVFQECGLCEQSGEIAALSRYLCSEESISNSVASDVISWDKFWSRIQKEFRRGQWKRVGPIIQRYFQRKTWQGMNVEKLMSNYDDDGDDFMTFEQGQQWLRDSLREITALPVATTSLNKSEITIEDQRIFLEHFVLSSSSSSSSSSTSSSNSTATSLVSLREICAFLGLKFRGNVSVKLFHFLVNKMGGTPSSASSFVVTAEMLDSGRVDVNKMYSYEEMVDQLVHHFSADEKFSPEILREIVVESTKLSLTSPRKCNWFTFLQFLGFSPDFALPSGPSSSISTKATSSASIRGTSSAVAEVEWTVDIFFEKLRELLKDFGSEKLKPESHPVDQIFRALDSNGDGFLTPFHVFQGLKKLLLLLEPSNGKSKSSLFFTIPWKSFFLNLINKLSSSSTSSSSSEEFGLVSISQLYKSLQLPFDYQINELQKLCQILAVAQSKGLSISQIFQALDEDQNGYLEEEEFQKGLLQIGAFEKISNPDMKGLMKHFPSSSNGASSGISLSTFLQFFEEEIRQLEVEKRDQLNMKIALRFHRIFQVASSKGLSWEEMWKHFDPSQIGKMDESAMKKGLEIFPHWKSLSPEDFSGLFDFLDYNGDREISKEEFLTFLEVGPLYRIWAEEVKNGNNMFLKSSEPSLDSQDKALDNGNSKPQAKRSDMKSNSSSSSSGNNNNNEGKPLLEDLDRILDFFQAEVRSWIQLSHENRLANRKTSSKELETWNSLEALVATLDPEGRGKIRQTSLSRLLDGQRFFAKVSENHFFQAIEPLFLVSSSEDSRSSGRGPSSSSSNSTSGWISASALLRFLEGTPMTHCQLSLEEDNKWRKDIFTPENCEYEGTDASNKGTVVAYEFSSDPEIQAVEKKFRSWSRSWALSGRDLSGMSFRPWDPQGVGMVSRGDFLEWCGTMGIPLVESHSNDGSSYDDFHGRGRPGERNDDLSGDELRRLQLQQLNRIRGSQGPSSLRRHLPIASASSAGAFRAEAKESSSFQNQMEALTIIKAQRQYQKNQLIHQVVSQASTVDLHLYPRLGHTLFFEFPFTNPFPEETRFEIWIEHPECRIVHHYEEWLWLRHHCSPCLGDLGPEPCEMELFDDCTHRKAGSAESNNFVGQKTQVVLLPQETLRIPFTYLTLIPCFSRDFPGGSTSTSFGIKFIASNSGNVISNLRMHLHPQSFPVHRILRFFEAEQQLMQQKLIFLPETSTTAGSSSSASYEKYIHCVEPENLLATSDLISLSLDGPSASMDAKEERSRSKNSSSSYQGAEKHLRSRVVVEWENLIGSQPEFGNATGGVGSSLWPSHCRLQFRYKCPLAPGVGTFYLLIYNDPYQCSLSEIIQVVVTSRHRIDVHGSLGSLNQIDFLVRGDRLARRVQTYPSVANSVPSSSSSSSLGSSSTSMTSSSAFSLTFSPPSTFGLVANTVNKFSAALRSLTPGLSKVLINLVDVDSKELISAWIVYCHNLLPETLQRYDVHVTSDTAKKILFRNPWNVVRRFQLISSDPSWMQPKDAFLEVGPQDVAYLRLRFFSSQRHKVDTMKNAVFLYLIDENGSCEESFQFNLFP